MSGTGLERAVIGASGCESRSYKMYSFKPQEHQFFNKQKQMNRMRAKLEARRLARMVYQCVLCDEMCTGYGNNPYPLAPARNDMKGACCDDCNEKVIRARIATRVSCQPKTQRC